MSDDRSLQTLLRAIDTELLVMALKGADEQIREKLFNCMSKRAAANIVDEMEALGLIFDARRLRAQLGHLLRGQLLHVGLLPHELVDHRAQPHLLLHLRPLDDLRARATVNH